MGHRSVGTRMNQFWQRATDGLELNQLWNACSKSQSGSRFITAFLAEYEPATRTLTYVNA